MFYLQLKKLRINTSSSCLKTFKSNNALGLLILIIAFGLFLDSKFVAENIFKRAQWINDAIVLIIFIYLFSKGTSRVKEQLIYAVLIGIIGEYVFSLGLSMYTYRLGNIPHYVPFGHAIVFLFVYAFTRKSKARFYRKKIEQLLSVIILIYASLFLIFAKDVFGFILTIFVFISLKKHPKEKLFYLTMYCVVAILEIIGTSFECWKWPVLAFDTFSFLPSANPPSGICLFYFGLDRGTMSIYKRRHKATWKRLQSIRLLSE